MTLSYAATPTTGDDERYARISLFTREMDRRFAHAPRYEAKGEIVPSPIVIRAIPNYCEVALDSTTLRGHQHVSRNSYLVAVESEEGSISGERFLIEAEELHANYRQI